MKKGLTPSQTIGPFFAYGLTPVQHGYDFADLETANLLTPDVTGERIRLEGSVYDGNEAVISDALVEIWQADAEGRFRTGRENSQFKGFGRCSTGADPDNRYRFETIKPGAVDCDQAPHISLLVFMRGTLRHYHTRAYFSDCQEANLRDPVLAAMPEERRETLIAHRRDQSESAVYRFDIHMQGSAETVFFDLAQN